MSLENRPDGQPVDELPLQFEEGERRALIQATRAIIGAVASDRNPADDPTCQLPSDLGQLEVFGLFVTLKRAGSLRACRGRWTEGSRTMPLGRLLHEVVRETTLSDSRFPRITASEIGLLSIDFSFMHSFEEVDLRGADLAEAVEIGRHGLVIAHGDRRGLLLPQVATEARWNPVTFLENVCRKAELPRDTWTSNIGSEIATFETVLVRADGPVAHLDPIGINGTELLSHASDRLDGKSATPSAPLAEVHGDAIGVALRDSHSGAALASSIGTSIAQLVENAVGALQNRLRALGEEAEPNRISEATLLTRGIELDPRDYPERFNHLGEGLLLALRGKRWFMGSSTAADSVGRALRGVDATVQEWIDNNSSGAVRVLWFRSMTYRASTDAALETAPSVREPAHAGRFYPADAASCADELHARFEAVAQEDDSVAPEPCRAVMLPHAGWQYCGSIVARTLARVVVPQTVILIGPQHTRSGPPNSIASHDAWRFPGYTVDIDQPWRDRVDAAAPELAREALAHGEEHGSEVLVPFLRHRNPTVRIVPIVFGARTHDEAQRFGEQLAGALRTSPELGRPLLVISSDMNHFADDTENRRRDRLALDALESGDSRSLFETCTTNDISMCGLASAAAVVATLHALGRRPQFDEIAYGTSADTGADPDRVVGYAGVTIR